MKVMTRGLRVDSAILGVGAERHVNEMKHRMNVSKTSLLVNLTVRKNSLLLEVVLTVSGSSPSSIYELEYYSDSYPVLL